MVHGPLIDVGPIARGSVPRAPVGIPLVAIVSSFIALLVSSAVHAADTSVGSWRVGAADDGTLYAYTLNDSGHVFGQWCDPDDQSCIWLLGIDTSCDDTDDGTYPVLVNANTGAASLTVGCLGRLRDLSIHRYAFSDFDRIDAIAREASNVGFAFPLESGRFVVERFDLSGSTKALDLMRSMALRRSTGAPGTKSQIM